MVIVRVKFVFSVNTEEPSSLTIMVPPLNVMIFTGILVVVIIDGLLSLQSYDFKLAVPAHEPSFIISTEPY